MLLVLMLSDERNKKPNALPIRYVPYSSLQDQYVRDLTRDVNLKMQEKELNLVGHINKCLYLKKTFTYKLRTKGVKWVVLEKQKLECSIYSKLEA